jgi:uncharacterized membrane protein
MITLSTFALLVLSQLAIAAGEVCLKQASGSNHKPVAHGAVRAGWYSVGIASMCIWFFVWLQLMHFFELNRIFAFEGASPLLVAFASALFLEEKITMRAWFASFLISIGISLVALF